MGCWMSRSTSRLQKDLFLFFRMWYQSHSLGCMSYVRILRETVGIWLKDTLAGWTFQNCDSSLLHYFLEMCVLTQWDALPLHTVLPPLQSWKVSSKSRFFFFFSYSGLPPFWVTAADLAHVHHLLKNNLSDDSSADIAHWQRTFDESLQLAVIVKMILILKCF